MHPEIARNQNYDDHYADDSKDVHSALLLHSDVLRMSAAMDIGLSPPPISPIATPSEEQEHHEDNKDEVHRTASKYLVGSFLSLNHVGTEL